MPRIQSLGITACHCIKHQQRLAGIKSRTLGGGEQGGSNPLPTYASLHQHLRNVSAVRLIFRLIQNYLNSADNHCRSVFSDEQPAFAARHTHCRASPEGFRFSARHGKHEADRGPTSNTIEQHVAQPLNLALSYSFQTSNLNVVTQLFISPNAAPRPVPALSLRALLLAGTRPMQADNFTRKDAEPDKIFFLLSSPQSSIEKRANRKSPKTDGKLLSRLTGYVKVPP
jgi:hypothetical protein